MFGNHRRFQNPQSAQRFRSVQRFQRLWKFHSLQSWKSQLKVFKVFDFQSFQNSHKVLRHFKVSRTFEGFKVFEISENRSVRASVDHVLETERRPFWIPLLRPAQWLLDTPGTLCSAQLLLKPSELMPVVLLFSYTIILQP